MTSSSKGTLLHGCLKTGKGRSLLSHVDGGNRCSPEIQKKSRWWTETRLMSTSPPKSFMQGISA